MKEIKGLLVESNGVNNSIIIDDGSVFYNSRLIINGDNNNIVLSKCLSYGALVINIKGNSKKINIGPSLKNINNLKIVSIRGDNQNVSIGRDFSCGGFEIQMNDGDENLTIGSGCLFSWGIKARTSDGHSVIDLEKGRAINLPKNIYIADRVWVGEDVSFLKGSKILEDSVVGSRSVVTKSFNQTNVVIAGFPAKVVKKNISWDRKKPMLYNSEVDDTNI